MSKTDYRKLMNKDYLGAWDAAEADLILTIESVAKETVKGEGGKEDECMVIHFSEKDTKPMVCNVTNAQRIAKIANSKYVEDWKGVRIALYAEPNIKVGKVYKDGLRVREYAPKLPDKVMCADCGKEIQAHGPVSAKQIAEGTRGTYGRPLCWDCSQKAKAEMDAKAKESDVL